MACADKVGQQRRTSSYLPATLYCYLEPRNKRWAKTFGKKTFGSHSAYINALIAKDQGLKPVLGFWKAKGEAKKIRLAKKNKETRKKKERTLSRHARKARIKREIA